jgi:hypothetical protein
MSNFNPAQNHMNQNLFDFTIEKKDFEKRGVSGG